MNDRESIFDEDRRARREDDGDAWAVRGRAFVRWLSRRPGESWLFFIAGLLAGGVFL